MTEARKDLCIQIVAVSLIVLSSLAASAQTETILHTFTGGSDGGSPQAGLIFDSKGNLYGTTGGGGTSSFCTGCGVAFQLVSSSNGTWTENVLYSFGTLNNFADGANPYSSLTFDSTGNLYGTTTSGGSSFQGTVFELTPGSSGTWTETTLYTFTGGSDGGFPYAEGVVLDSSGNLYGTTESGGKYGFGTVYELVKGSGGKWTELVLHSFAYGNDGAFPFGSPVILDAAGNLYGVASNGGFHDSGVVYKLVPGSNGHWAEQILYSFPGGPGGSFPTGKLVFDTAGNLYGQASYIVYELSPSSSGTWTAQTLHSFLGGPDGANPYAGLIMDKSGNLYGTTNTGGNHRGTVYELSPSSNGTWTEKILHRFSTTGGDGIFPNYAGLVIDASGNLYGTVPQGGSSNAGVIFAIAP
jgi:uncharacterized repeat protein (TIGR03803 family)